MTRVRCLVLTMVCLGACGWPGSKATWSQEDSGATIFLPAPRMLRQHLVRASKAAEEQRFGDAVAEIGLLLAEEGAEDGFFSETHQDFFVGPFAGSIVQSSIKRDAERLLAEMPNAARELYELQFGADAREMLDQATLKGDLIKLAEVTRKYFHTSAGYEATMLLGRLQLDRGHPLAAAMCFQRLAEAPAAARRFDPELSLLLAACWSFADRDDRSLETLVKLRDRFPNLQLRIGEAQVRQLPAPSEAEAWLASQFGARHVGKPRQADEWVLFRGDATRNVGSSGSEPLPTFRWQVPTASAPSDDTLIRELYADKIEQREPMLPALQPLAVDDVILMRTPERLLALDFETGKRVWEFPWWEAGDDDVTLTGRASHSTTELQVRRDKFLQRLWQDAPYGQLSSDGKFVYLLNDLRYATPFGGQFMPNQRGLRSRNADWPESHNELVALELKRQGAMRWRVGGETGDDEPQLAGAFFLGVPLPISGQLYVLAEQNSEIRLVALDAETGKLLWSQQLAHVADLAINENPVRRLAGATPSCADGVLICPTSAGAVVAVDLATRSLLWGYQYQEPPRRTGFGIARSWQQAAYQNQSRWLDASVTISDGLALITPVEDELLICVDLQLTDGQPRWTVRREDDLEDALFVACIHNGQAVIVAKDKLLALSMRDGTAAWSKPVELQADQGEMPSGRGFQNGRYYFLPTTTSHLLTIDLEEGSVVSRHRTHAPLGNLICYRDEVIAHSANSVSSAYQIEPLRQRVARRLESQPDDSWALARQGELLLYGGESHRALEVFEKAHALDPQDVDVRNLLVTTFLNALKEDFAAHRDRSALIEPLIDLPRQRHEYLRLTAAGFHQAGDWQRALDAYLNLAVLETESLGEASEEDSELVKVSSTRSIRLDRWLRAGIEQLLSAADEGVVQDFETYLRTRADAAADQSIAQLQRDVQHFGFHPACQPIRIELAKQLIDAGRWLEAERVLEPLRDSPDETIAGAATALLARLYTQSGQPTVAVRLYEELGSRWVDVACADGKTGRELLADAKLLNSLRPSFHHEGTWPLGRVLVESTSHPDRAPALSRMANLPVHVNNDLSPHGLVFGMDARGASIAARDAYGESLLQVRAVTAALNGDDQVQLDGHLGVVYHGHELIGVDVFQSARSPQEVERWRVSLPAPTQPPAQLVRRWNNPLDPTESTPRFNVDATGRAVSSMGPSNRCGVFYLRMRTLICADPLNGEPIWTQSDVEQGSQVFGDEQFIFAADPTADRAIVFRAADGEPLGERKLPAAADRWSFAGRFVLARDVTGNGIRVYVRDVWEQRDLWSENLSNAAKGTLTDGGLVGLLDGDGRFVLRSLTSEALAMQAMLEPDPALAALRIVSSPEQYLVFAITDLQTREASSRTVRAAHEHHAPVFDSRLYAFDRESGAAMWQVPAVIPEHGLALHQPTSSPALWFIRSISNDQTIRSPRNSDHASVLCLDRRDGRMLFSKEDIPTQPGEFNLVVDATKKTSTLYLPGHTFVATFTEEPVPPEPPVQQGPASSMPDESNVLADLFGSGLQTLKQQTTRASQESPFGDRQPE